MQFGFEHSYSRLPQQCAILARPTPVSHPRLIASNAALASFLRLDPHALTTDEAAAIFAGNALPDDAQPLALAYAGHQFGHFVHQLGDGRAILLGELVATDGQRYDVQLKGAGRTPFSRRGDGRAALGPVLREYVISEAMAALSVPTTRALAAVTTGDHVMRDEPSPGAVLVRVAASHLRVGTFEYFAARQDGVALQALVAYALERHYGDTSTSEGPALALFDAVMAAQLSLVARWLAVGFVHGVMNTDNCAISGETLDYGPCAFLDTFDPERTFSSIDHHGRYAFAQQPRIAAWNMARLGEALLPLVGSDASRAVALLTERLATFAPRFELAYAAELAKKLGLTTSEPGDFALARELLAFMAETRADYTQTFRALSLLRTDTLPSAWVSAWKERGPQEAIMRAANPAYIPRNLAIEHMITRATQNDFAPFHRLNAILARPYDEQPDTADLTTPPGAEQWDYRTFCGT